VTRRLRRSVAGAILLALVGPLVSAGPAAAAPDLGAARQRAAALLREVADLEERAEIATEDLNGIQDELGQVVTAYLTASEQLGELGGQRREQQAAASRRVRALYMAGGSTGLYATVLAGADIRDVLNRVDVVGRVLATEQGTIAATTRRISDAAAATARLDELAARRTVLEGRAEAARATIESTLARRQSELAAANALVLRLVEEERARAEAAAAARAAASLATSPDAPTTLPAGTPEVVVRAVAAARTKLGIAYTWGATGPDTFDCSGLTGWAYRQAGLALPRTSRQQWFAGMHPGLADLAPGDLLFWANDVTNPATIHHVALYIGQGYMIHAPRTGDVVRVAPVYLDGYIGATRPTVTATSQGR